MTRREEFGVCYAHAFDGSSYVFARACYETMLAEWMAGKAFYEGHGPFGQAINVKLSRIEGISDFSPDQIAAYDADQREQQQQDMISGDT